MSDLAAFLRARLDEDEAAAKAATPGPWRADGMSVRGAPEGSFAAPSARDILVIRHTWPQESAHIVRHDPARVLREVRAKRKIMARYSAGVRSGRYFAVQGMLEELASVYSDHLDYDPAWSVAGHQ